jgi:hypothetical protein
VQIGGKHVAKQWRAFFRLQTPKTMHQVELGDDFEQLILALR